MWCEGHCHLLLEMPFTPVNVFDILMPLWLRYLPAPAWQGGGNITGIFAEFIAKIVNHSNNKN